MRVLQSHYCYWLVNLTDLTDRKKMTIILRNNRTKDQQILYVLNRTLVVPFVVYMATENQLIKDENCRSSSTKCQRCRRCTKTDVLYKKTHNQVFWKGKSIFFLFCTKKNRSYTYIHAFIYYNNNNAFSLH